MVLHVQSTRLSSHKAKGTLISAFPFFLVASLLIFLLIPFGSTKYHIRTMTIILSQVEPKAIILLE